MCYFRIVPCPKPQHLFGLCGTRARPENPTKVVKDNQKRSRGRDDSAQGMGQCPGSGNGSKTVWEGQGVLYRNRAIAGEKAAATDLDSSGSGHLIQSSNCKTKSTRTVLSSDPALGGFPPSSWLYW